MRRSSSPVMCQRSGGIAAAACEGAPVLRGDGRRPRTTSMPLPRPCVPQQFFPDSGAAEAELSAARHGPERQAGAATGAALGDRRASSRLAEPIRTKRPRTREAADRPLDGAQQGTSAAGVRRWSWRLRASSSAGAAKACSMYVAIVEGQIAPDRRRGPTGGRAALLPVCRAPVDDHGRHGPPGRRPSACPAPAGAMPVHSRRE